MVFVVLIPLIIDNLEEGSTIMSDKFSSYVNIKTNQSKLEQYGFEHFWTNHSLNFVDPYQPWIDTNSFERQWRSLKNKISTTIRAFSNAIIRSYLVSFMIKTRLTHEELYLFTAYTLRT